MKYLALAVAFILELIAFGYIATIGIFVPADQAVRIAVGVGLLVAVVVFWAMFMAPQAARRLRGATYVIVKLVIYTIAALAIAKLYDIRYGVIFMIVTVVDEIVVARYPEPSSDVR